MSLKQFHGHYAVIFGILCGLLDLDAVVLQRMYLFYTLRDILSDATRLNLIGPMESLKLQQELAATAEEILQKNKNRKIEQCHHLHIRRHFLRLCKEIMIDYIHEYLIVNRLYLVQFFSEITFILRFFSNLCSVAITKKCSQHFLSPFTRCSSSWLKEGIMLVI